jgi:hypothetical protein
VRYVRRAAKRDVSEPAIVEALERAGWEVHRELPVDLLCLKRAGNVVKVRLLECKSPQGKSGKARKRKDQPEQVAFCERWEIEKPTNAQEALLAVGEVIHLDP